MLISEISINRPILATVMNLAVAFFGLNALQRLPVRELPDVDAPIVNVSTVYPGASAEVVETQVTEPLEETISGIEGIKTLTSESREQVSQITVEFSLTRDIEFAAQDVRDRVSRVRGRLPDEIDEPIVSKQDADAQPMMWIALFSDRYSTLELTRIAEDTLQDPLQTVPGVSSIFLGGAKRYAIRLWLDPQKMAAHGITVADIETALRTQSIELPSGRVENLDRELTVQTEGQLKTPEEYNRMVIAWRDNAPVRLSDIGRAEAGVEDERSIARFKGNPAMGLGIVRQSKANTIEVAKGVKAQLEKLVPLLPEGVQVQIAYDESEFVEHSIREVWSTLAFAFLLVVLSIFIFLHNVRSTIIPAVTIPISLISTFGVMYLFNFSVNTITMLALVLAIGIVVDDTIVVLENIYRHIQEGQRPRDAAFRGMREIGLAVIATTAALVAVFLPLAFQTTDTGRLFIEFAIAIAFSVMISTFVALTLTPMLCANLLKPHPEQVHGFFGVFEHWLEWTTEGYEKNLRRALAHPMLVLGIAAASLAVGAYWFMRLEREFLPEEDKGRLFCMVITPEGSTSEYTDRQMREMEGIFKETEGVDAFFTAVAMGRGGPGLANQAFAFVRLKDGDRPHVSEIVGGPRGLQGRFFMDIEGAFAIPIIPKAIGRGFGQPFQLVLQHQNLESLHEAADVWTNKLRGMPLLQNVRTTFELNRPELRVAIDRERAADLGVSVETISRTLQVLFGGSDLSKVNLEGKEYDVIAQLQRKERLTPSDFDKIYVRGAGGRLVQLTTLVQTSVGGGPSSIPHYNRLRSATIEGTPAPGVPLGRIMDEVEDMLAQDLGGEFRYEWAGEAKDLLETRSEGGFVFLTALIVVYMVLAAQFESWVHPFTIMLTLPLAAFGAFGSLWLLNKFGIPGMNLNLFSQIGIILLIGLVTKNAILLVDFANQRMAQGQDAFEAMVRAGVVRLRPILMTTVTTVVGIMPIAIGFGAGAESRRPMGVTAVFGLAASTVLTFFVIPVVYVMISNWRERLKQRREKRARIIKVGSMETAPQWSAVHKPRAN